MSILEAVECVQCISSNRKAPAQRLPNHSDIANLKSAVLQDASAFSNAKNTIQTKASRERWTEMANTRYSVVFTGAALPDGTQADAVHIVLGPPYPEVLNQVETRAAGLRLFKGPFICSLPTSRLHGHSS